MRCWWIVILMIRCASAQHVYDVYSLSMASADVCGASGSYLGRNPASIASQQMNVVGFTQILPYGIKSLSSNLFYASGKIKSQMYAVDVASQGIEGYKEYLSSLSAGMKLGENFSLGVKMMCSALNIKDVGLEFRYRLELGMVENFGKKLSSGIHFKLRNTKTIEVFQNTVLSAGLRYYLDSKLPFYVSYELSEIGPPTFRAALEYKTTNALAVRMAWNSIDAGLSIGMAYNYRKTSIEMGSNYHNRLGLSYGVGMGYRWGQ